ncbi:unnamed protein product [Polarella glacialis]|uniref:Uncharacterized protein n=1 Tax=Polarella glacialis TaxID=89957 RepID=A0A813L051_POLGL|nr:unnamed protein product [Polarella glacialis]
MEADNFDVADNKIGPNMYTVSAQYVQPLAQKAGSMSWALMRNPEGLKCDLFITHGWIEGIFELIDKVVYSWPVGNKAAYCCVFSNPQTLDIASLLRIPRESPFAKSLDSATHMLVVPNQSTSIYSRLWCVYEAYLAFSMDRVILTATAPIRRRVLRCLAWQCLFLVMGLIAGISYHQVDEKKHHKKPVWALPAMMLLGFLSKPVHMCKGPDKWWCPKFPLLLAINSLGMFLASASLGQILAEAALESVATCKQCVTFYLIFFGYFLLSEVDRVRATRQIEEARCLSRGFTSVQNADCSSPADALQIQQEIQREMAEVDEAIVMLRSSGMSTPALREAFLHGADVRGAGNISYSNLCFSMGMWFLLQGLYLGLALDGKSPGLLSIWII